MITKRITYESLFDEGTQVTQTYYFNMNESEFMEMDAEYTSNTGMGFSETIKTIIASEDPIKLFPIMREIIHRSIGYRDGESFMKSEEYWNKFYHSPAYNALLQEIMSSDKANVDFLMGILPRDTRRKAMEAMPSGATPLSGHGVNITTD